ncbi:hypothetical protein DEJ21_05990 [Curtobacterium sp. MCSS17_006]|uniref:hypothetical protein n=1 Tax=Curtobacterium sp. MCSS17_006 TaxID=2175642 RepID=UPI000DA8F3E6|nr:hypothetical protein [Curtobacterium sp. MCSS17_006]PZE38085.1 hypothetical protein DEJ21_05990 [Curtobacterium sp. MCSS17_006]
MSAEVDVLLDPGTALRRRALYWTSEGKLIVDADGRTEHDHDGTLGDSRRAFYARRARLGREAAGGPDLITELRFRLAAAPEVGEFTFSSTEMGQLGDDASVADALEAADGPILATLKIEPVSFVAKNGPMKGQEVNYNKPVLTLKGAAPAAE